MIASCLFLKYYSNCQAQAQVFLRLSLALSGSLWLFICDCDLSLELTLNFVWYPPTGLVPIRSDLTRHHYLFMNDF